MKKNLRKLSVVLLLALVFSSMELAGVFATDVPAEVTPPATTEPAVVQPETTPVNPEEPEVKACSSYRSVWLEWEAVPNNNVGNTNFDGMPVKYIVNKKDVGTKLSYHAKKLEVYKKHKFKVQAYIEGRDGTRLYSEVAKVSKAPVRPIRYILTVRQSGTLRSHEGPRATMSVKSGQKVYADRFSTGSYIFTGKNGKSTFFISRMRLGKKTAEFSKKLKYTREEAEHFVNDKGLASKTKTLIWVSTYTQHVYFFTGKRGKWECKYDWECATGTASEPTPTSTTGIKQIGTKLRSKHALPFWSAFHGTASFHGKRTNWKVGQPASNGCVRNPNKYAKLIYTKAKRGTGVQMY